MGWGWNEEKVWNRCEIRKMFGMGEGAAWKKQGIWELTPKTPKLTPPRPPRINPLLAAPQVKIKPACPCGFQMCFHLAALTGNLSFSLEEKYKK